MATTTKYTCDRCGKELEKAGEKVYITWLGHLQTHVVKELCPACFEATLGMKVPEEEQDAYADSHRQPDA